jgi:hypothetical protein
MEELQTEAQAISLYDSFRNARLYVEAEFTSICSRKGK